MIDQEGGLVKRLPGAPSRSAAGMGATGDVSAVRAEGVATARNLRGVGVNVDLAPVLDPGLPGSFQRATGRSFAQTPAAVALRRCVRRRPGRRRRARGGEALPRSRPGDSG